METINWKIEGMSCSTCALTIGKYLEKKGGQNVKVSLASGDVSFDTASELDPGQLQQGITDLGYTVVKEDAAMEGTSKTPINKHLRYFLFCLPFTVLLLARMFGGAGPLDWLMHPWIQLLLCLPVFVAGMGFFGRSAVISLLNGRLRVQPRRHAPATGTRLSFL
jgi:Cu+-exporting ATPase